MLRTAITPASLAGDLLHAVGARGAPWHRGSTVLSSRDKRSGGFGEGPEAGPHRGAAQPYWSYKYLRGSVMRPSMALAITVAGLARKMRASGEPMRPL